MSEKHKLLDDILLTLDRIIDLCPKDFSERSRLQMIQLEIQNQLLTLILKEKDNV